jgi:hypothetical protein
MTNTQIVWTVASVSIGALSFLIGGGAVGRWLKRASRLIDVAEMKEHFVSREEFNALAKENGEWRQRMLTEVIEPQREFGRTLATLAASSAVQTESIRFLGESVHQLSEDLRYVQRGRPT